jgi:hypothetical protein
MSPEEYLQAKGFKVRIGSGELQTQCPFCGDTNKYGHLYVNRDHGAYFCHRCGAAGSFHQLQGEFGDKTDLDGYLSIGAVWKDMVALSRDSLLEEPDAWSYLRTTRGLTAETIDKYHLGWVPPNWMDSMLKKWTIKELMAAGLVIDRDGKHYPLFWNRVLIPYLYKDRVVTLRAKEIGGGLLQAKDTSIRLFGVDNIADTRDAYVCEGEFDAMFLDQAGYPACAVPGALSFQENWVAFFASHVRVILCLDADDAGRKGTAKIVDFLGDKARPVEWPVPEGQRSTDVTEFFLRDLHVKEAFDALVRTAFPPKSLTFIEVMGLVTEMASHDGLKLNIRDIDLNIEPGILPGQIVTLLAKTGTGKTAFLTQVANNLSGYSNYQGTDHGPAEPVLFLSLEQTSAEVGNRLLRAARIVNPWASDPEIAEWYSNFRINDSNRLSSQELREIAEDFEEQVGTPPKLILLDYLGYWARSFSKASRYEQVSEAIMELKALAKETGAAIIAPHQVSRIQKRGVELDMDMARDSGVVEESSDFMFGLYKPSEKSKDDFGEDSYRARADVRLEILKSRHGGVGRQSMLLWAPYSLSFVARGSEYEKRVAHEWTMYDIQAGYSDVLESHRNVYYSK